MYLSPVYTAAPAVADERVGAVFAALDSLGIPYIRFEHDEIIVAGKKTYKVRSVCYACPGCGCISTEAEMKRAPARWEADNPAAYEQGTRSFWLNAFVSQWASWESIILKYLNAIGSTRKMQVVYNTCFGELWEDRGDLEDEDSLMARREEYPAELPEGVLVPVSYTHLTLPTT